MHIWRPEDSLGTVPQLSTLFMRHGLFISLDFTSSRLDGWQESPRDPTISTFPVLSYSMLSTMKFIMTLIVHSCNETAS